jgi:hypothetical protein
VLPSDQIQKGVGALVESLDDLRACVCPSSALPVCALPASVFDFQVLPSDQIQKGVGALVESLDDLLLDVPDGVELLSLFIARGVVSGGVVSTLCFGREVFGWACCWACLTAWSCCHSSSHVAW